jgi:hypothetical protein
MAHVGNGQLLSSPPPPHRRIKVWREGEFGCPSVIGARVGSSWSVFFPSTPTFRVESRTGSLLELL